MEPMRNRQASAFVPYLLVDSPMGLLRLEATDQGLVAVDWISAQDSFCQSPQHPGAAKVLRQGAGWLAAYFKSHSPPPLPPLSLNGTEFQKAVWRYMAALPTGKLTTYGEIARAVGRPRACRAVGQAVGANPVAILVPCHRVLGSDGALRGYAWGLERKQALLELEREVLRRATDAEAPGGDPAEAPGSCAPGLPSAPPAGPWRRPCPPAGCS